MGLVLQFGRLIMFIINFILMLIGLGIFIFGIFFEKIMGKFMVLFPSHTEFVVLVIAILGACVAMFAFIGCFGAFYENYNCINVYAVLLTTIFLAQVVVLTMVYIKRGNVQVFMNDTMTNNYLDYEKNNITEHFIDNLQKQFECCGSTNNTTPWEQLNITRPSSCYAENNTAMFEKGCIDTLFDSVGKHETILTTMVGIDVILQIVAIIFCVALANFLKTAQLELLVRRNLLNY